MFHIVSLLRSTSHVAPVTISFYVRKAVRRKVQVEGHPLGPSNTVRSRTKGPVTRFCSFRVLYRAPPTIFRAFAIFAPILIGFQIRQRNRWLTWSSSSISTPHQAAETKSSFKPVGNPRQWAKSKAA